MLGGGGVGQTAEVVDALASLHGLVTDLEGRGLLDGSILCTKGILLWGGRDGILIAKGNRRYALSILTKSILKNKK